jgi:hypothetical protein
MPWAELGIGVIVMGALVTVMVILHRHGRLKERLHKQRKEGKDAAEKLRGLSGPMPGLDDALDQLSEPPEED